MAAVLGVVGRARLLLQGATRSTAESVSFATRHTDLFGIGLYRTAAFHTDVKRHVVRKQSVCITSRLLSRHANTGIIPGVKRDLGDIVKLELLEAEAPDHVAAVWEKYHEEREGTAGAVVPLAEFETIESRAKESPMFIFPVWREGGHFMLVSEYTPSSSMFAMTFLEDYKRNPSLATPWMSVLMFGDLAQSKKLGLLRAEVESARLTKQEAAHLLLLVRRYYGLDHYDQVWAFNHAQRHFDLDKYMKSCPKGVEASSVRSGGGGGHEK